MSAFWQTECVHGALAHVSNAGRHVATILTTGYRGATEPDHRFLGKAGGTESMPKILTARRREDERERARLYLKSRLMLPTIPLGMVTLLAGYGDIVPGRDQPVLSGAPGGLCGDLSPLGRLF